MTIPLRWALLILALSLAYTAAMFRGLEGHTGYSGCAWQVLFPQSFPGDAFMPSDRPVMLSLYYLLVKAVGPLWLDDRFTFFVFAGMTLLSLVALDKTARLLGVTGRLERAAILGLVLLEHRFSMIHVLLVDNYGFSGTALGAAVALWLLYGALAGWGPGRQLLLMALCLAVSMKNTWVPVIIALVLLWKDRLGAAAKRWTLLGMTLAVTGGLVYYTARLRPADGSDVALFDYILKTIDDAEANPFLYPLWGNLAFAGFCLLAFFLRDLPAELLRRIRIAAVIGLLTWFLGGVYLTYAPDFMKIPHLVPFDARRALRWPAYILFVACGVFLLKRVQRAASSRAAWLAWLALMGLYLAHEQMRWKLVVVVTGVAAALGLLRRTFSMAALSPAGRLQLAALPLLIGTLSLYTVGAIHQRGKALAHLVRTGILGDNLTAKWVGVDEYIRERTDPSATILAMSLEDTHRNPGPLQFDASLRTRTGRTMPMAHKAAFYLNYPKLQWWEERHRLMNELAAAWAQENLPEVMRGLKEFGSPDYLVIPASKSGWAERANGLGYRVETRIREFTIFRHDAR